MSITWKKTAYARIILYAIFYNPPNLDTKYICLYVYINYIWEIMNQDYKNIFKESNLNSNSLDNKGSWRILKDNNNNNMWTYIAHVSTN